MPTDGHCRVPDCKQLGLFFKRLDRHLVRVHPGLTRKRHDQLPLQNASDRVQNLSVLGDRPRRPCQIVGCRYYGVPINRLDLHMRKVHHLSVRLKRCKKNAEDGQAWYSVKPRESMFCSATDRHTMSAVSNDQMKESRGMPNADASRLARKSDIESVGFLNIADTQMMGNCTRRVVKDLTEASDSINYESSTKEVGDVKSESHLSFLTIKSVKIRPSSAFDTELENENGKDSNVFSQITDFEKQNTVMKFSESMKNPEVYHHEVKEGFDQRSYSRHKSLNLYEWSKINIQPKRENTIYQNSSGRATFVTDNGTASLIGVRNDSDFKVMDINMDINKHPVRRQRKSKLPKKMTVNNDVRDEVHNLNMLMSNKQSLERMRSEIRGPTEKLYNWNKRNGDEIIEKFQSNRQQILENRNKKGYDNLNQPVSSKCLAETESFSNCCTLNSDARKIFELRDSTTQTEQTNMQNIFFNVNGYSELGMKYASTQTEEAYFQNDGSTGRSVWLTELNSRLSNVWFSTKFCSKLSKHVFRKNFRKSGYFQCEICSKRFQLASRYQRHMKAHKRIGSNRK